MEYLSAFILAFIQSATEFLPISSSGHLQVYKNFSNGGLNLDLTFDVVLHAGTMVATLIYFRFKLSKIAKGIFNDLKEIINTIKNKNNLKQFLVVEGHSIKYALMIVIASIPVGVVGILYKESLEKVFSQILWVGIGFSYTSLLLFSTLFLERKGYSNIPNWKLALVVGFFQMVAILPGVSRSASCLVAALWIGASKKMAAEFAFIISLPVIGGATLLGIKDFAQSNTQLPLAVVLGAFTISLIFGWLFLKILLSIFNSGKLYYFGFYTLLLSVVCLFLL